MKITKLEWGALAVTALTLVAMVFYFWGSRSLASPVTITAREAEASVEATSQIAQVGSQETEETEESVFPIDLNTATETELMLLPNIGEARAAAIVAYREEHGPFTYVEELLEVKGIGEGILESIMDYVTVS